MPTPLINTGSAAHIHADSGTAALNPPYSAVEPTSVARPMPFYFRMKAGVDQLAGCVLLVVASPVIAAVWCAVKLTSPGPGFYLQQRVGLNGQLFRIVKMRTMVATAEQGGKIQWSKKGDARVTPLGRWLRKLHLDELSQLWNVARGEMALIGPRPERPEITASLAQLIPGYHLRHRVKPGVTGLSQVNLEPDSDINLTRKKQILDLRYIAMANPWLDSRLLFATALRMIGIKGERVMELAGLRQEISDRELVAVGYQFNACPDELWDPTQGTVEQFTPVSVHSRRPCHAHKFPDFRDAAGDIPNAFTVDVEDYFQVSAFEKRVSRKHWDRYESRIEANTNRLLDILERNSVVGTFFVLGWIADRYPDLVRRIHAAGHELASHGYWHRLVYNQSPDDFADDICTSRYAIEAASGVSVTAYRAPSFSITNRSLWALEVLAEHGFTHDSSIFPIAGHDRYGIPGARREIHQINTRHGSITEFPPSAWHVKNVSVPLGGGYFRIFPLAVTMKSMQEVRRAGRPAMFYMHPWEVDPAQPRIPGTPWRSRMRHYTGLRHTAGRIDALFDSFSFSTLSDVVSQVARGDSAEFALPLTDAALSPRV